MDYETSKRAADDYANVLCESVKIISESLLEGLKFDKTIVCTIVDDSKRDVGTYTVTDGSVSFVAYSENKNYRNKNEVYVTIPNGDYDNNKIITGKKMSNDSIEPFVYTSPFSTIVDVSGNLITTTDNCGLVANAPQIYYETIFDDVNETNFSSYYVRDEDTLTYSIATSYDENQQYYVQHTDGLNKVIFEKEYANPYYNFTRLGLQAQFQAWLQEYDCVAGNYGLKLTVQFIPESSVAQDLKERMTKVLYLDINDMIGNPYAFESYYNQEKVFDISSFGGLTYIKLEFFQKEKSFYTREGNALPYLNDFNNEILFSNLFVKDCRVCIGYEIGSYDTEFVSLNSFNSKTYTSKVDDPIKNKKEISLKWIHIDEEGNQIQVDKDSPYEYEIRWYRYILGEPSADNYCGPGWTSPSHERNKEAFIISAAEKGYVATLQPDVALMEVEQIKVIILFGQAPGYTHVQSLTKTTYDMNPAKYYILENNQYINCYGKDYESRNYYIQNEDTRKIYHSNIIEFSNENSVINSATLDAIQALTLICQDEIDGVRYATYGNYLLYDQANRLIDNSQSHITRLIGCQLNLSATPGDDTDTLRNADSITWRFPLNNTMINCIMTNKETGSSLVLEEVDDKGNKTGYGLVTIDDPKILDSDITIYKMPIFKYTISSIYSPSKSNNFIECTVSKDGVNYHAIKELSFGQSGTSGTDWTFAIDFDQTFNAILIGEKDVEYSVTASLYDSSGKLEDISNKTIDWKFVDPLNTSNDLSNVDRMKLELQSVTVEGKNQPHRKKIVLKNNLTINDLIILKATIKDWGDYELTAFLPIALRASNDYLYLTGATQIIYLTDGNPIYYNKYYEMHGTRGDKAVDLTDELTFGPIYGDPDIITKNNGKGLKYMPEVSAQTSQGQLLGYKLKPVSLYTSGLPIFGVQVFKGEDPIWTQPILIIQNNYPAAMVNKWNGKELVLDEENSAILSNMIGAGSKDDQNRFSGILLGDWRGQSSANSKLDDHTGLFGFHEGVLSYSLTEDGKATFGKATTGQIIIDGSSSTIESAGFSLNPANGMQIDLSNNTIIAKRNNNIVFKLDGSNNNDNYFTISTPDVIKNGSSVVLMNVGSNNYYLQSSNYETVQETTANTSYVNLGKAYSLNTFNRWKALYTTLYNSNKKSISSYSYGIQCYYKTVEYKDVETTNGSYFNLSTGELIINRGTINGDVILKPSEGIRYPEYTTTSYSSGGYSWYTVTQKTQSSSDSDKHFLEGASLVSVLSDLYGTLNYASAVANAANNNAASAQSLASSAEATAKLALTASTNANKACERTEWVGEYGGVANGNIWFNPGGSKSSNCGKLYATTSGAGIQYYGGAGVYASSGGVSASGGLSVSGGLIVDKVSFSSLISRIATLENKVASLSSSSSS